uniref:Uncharacterized protein n=1 Tax=Panagrolaimus sp. JU765 TaxID=591449 RepID=A0AC34R8J1_9BILA
MPAVCLCLCPIQQTDAAHEDSWPERQGNLPLLHLPDAVLRPLNFGKTHAEMRGRQPDQRRHSAVHQLDAEKVRSVTDQDRSKHPIGRCQLVVGTVQNVGQWQPKRQSDQPNGFELASGIARECQLQRHQQLSGEGRVHSR